MLFLDTPLLYSSQFHLPTALFLLLFIVCVVLANNWLATIGQNPQRLSNAVSASIKYFVTPIPITIPCRLMRVKPLTLTICVILVASLILSTLRFGGTRRRSVVTPTITHTTTTITTHEDEQFPSDLGPDTTHDPDMDHDDLFTLTNDDPLQVEVYGPPSPHHDRTHDPPPNPLPFSVPPQRAIRRLKPGTHRPQFGNLFRSPLSSNGRIAAQQLNSHNTGGDGFDHTWFPALRDIEAAREQLLTHEQLKDDVLKVAKLHIVNDMVVYRSWRIDCVAGAMERVLISSHVPNHNERPK
jgi:hypothetical protein